ncbi:hydrophobic protein [Kitasatospora sp. RB6PN24]|uniref:hydrophobic protein n=1 Tax=Kitasatospora humi TaxID=2893891 RepID=UPI001E494B91|nr:hydrophobic protein [Kitasatospora humi]MCC9305781.1 hydrophobic protein [Kitasatospora humi]
MVLLLLVFIIVVILGGLGFAVHVLWWVALVLFVLWLLGFLLRRPTHTGARGRWYRW